MDAFFAIGKLLLTLGVLVGALLYVRRWAQRGVGQGRQAGVRVAARTALTRGAVVAVVDVDGRRFLLGAGEQQVRLIAELDPPVDETDSDPGFTAMGADGGASRTAPHLFPRPATDAQARTMPGIGLMDRLRAMTVRTHVEGPIRALDD